MSMLEGFKAFNFSEGVPYASITNNGITFNKAVVMKLDFPEHVILLINEEAKKIAVQVASSDDNNAVPFYKKKKNDVLSVRWNGRDLLNTLQTMMGWKLKEASYRVDGLLLREEKAMLFDFSKAVKLD